jgi:hypothetical protein
MVARSGPTASWIQDMKSDKTGMVQTWVTLCGAKLQPVGPEGSQAQSLFRKPRRGGII